MFCQAFSPKIKELCWDKTIKLHDYPNFDKHYDKKWAFDYSGGLVHKDLNNCNGLFCYNFVHLHKIVNEVDYDDLSNCEVLQVTVAKELRKKANAGIGATDKIAMQIRKDYSVKWPTFV